MTGFAPAWALVPLAISGLLLLWARSEPLAAQGPAPHVGKLIVRWSVVEGAAIVIASNLLHHFHHAEFMFPAIAVIVGLHFVPLARGIPIRLYYATAAGLVLIAISGTLLPAADRPITIGLGAAAILWATAIIRILHTRRTAASA